MIDYTVLDKPKQIMTAGEKVLLGTATGIPPGVITDKVSAKHVVAFPSLIVPGLGRNLFSSSDAATTRRRNQDCHRSGQLPSEKEQRRTVTGTTRRRHGWTLFVPCGAGRERHRAENTNARHGPHNASSL